MAFVPWKDRVTSTPHRYKLTEVSADTYDLEAVPGSISEAGTPVNAENLNKLIQRDGDDIKDTVVAFTEASTRANIGTGESTATLFGKIKKWYTDLKTHAFTTPSTSQGTSTTTVPSDKLLKESSFARVYRSFADLGIPNSSTIAELHSAMIDRSRALIPASTYNHPTYGNTGLELPNDYFYVLEAIRQDDQRLTLKLVGKAPNSAGLCQYEGMYWNYGTTNKFTGWKKIKTGSLVSLGGASATSGKYIRFARVSFTGTFAEVSGVFLVYDNNHLNYERHTCVLTLSCLTGSTTGPVANSVKIDGVNIDESILNEFYVSFNPTYNGTANTFDFYFKQVSTHSSIVVEFLSSSTRNGATQMNPVQNYFDLALEYDGAGAVITYDTIPTQGEVATFLSKMSTLPVYFPVSPLVPTTPSGPSAAVAKSYVDLKVALAGAETITGIKTFATGATPLITDAPTTDLMAVNKGYVDGLSTPYSKVIRTQAEFNELINSPTWLGAESVALVGQFTLSTANNSGIKVPATVKQIHGFNSAKITVTNFLFNPSTSNGGLWYDTLPTTLDYSIRDLEVDCTGGGAVEFGFGFRRCSNLMNCTGTGRGAGAPGYGFYDCQNLTNCMGTGTGSSGYGFYSIYYASNCKDGGSKTNMWGGTNKNIDLDTCRKTPVAVTSGELTALNT